jgi:hypothetical protein
MKKYLLILTLFISVINLAQVGIGTTNPYSTSILDLTASNKALLLPRVANTAAVAVPVNGMMIYDISSNCVKSYENSVWTGCLSATETNTISNTVAVNCATSGFVGSMFNTLVNANNATGVHYRVTIVNNTFASVTIPLAASDLVLSGASAGQSVSTISTTAAGAAVTSVTIAAGASSTVFYRIAGTPTTSGTITGTWTKGVLTCEKTATVEPKPTFVASLNSTVATTNSTNGSLNSVDIATSSFISNSNPALLANSLFNASGDFVAPYTGTYTFTFKTWTASLSGFSRWDFLSISNGVRVDIFTQSRIPTGTQVTVNYNLVAGQIISFHHQACSGCVPTTSVNFGNLAFEVSY